jgi:TctA family transporter
MALMIGALMIQGISPGPQVMQERPELFWGLIASMFVGNMMLIFLNLPLIRLWIALIRVPYHFLFPTILLFCCIGSYSISNAVFDVYLTAVFAVLGYIFLKLECEPAPLILGFILGPLMEENLRRALLINRGDPSVFVTNPLSLGLLIASACLIVVIAAPVVRKKRDEAMRE